MTIDAVTAREPEPAEPVNIQFRAGGEPSGALTIYGVDPGRLLEELFRDQISRGRSVRRDGKLYVPGAPESDAPKSDAA